MRAVFVWCAPIRGGVIFTLPRVGQRFLFSQEQTQMVQTQLDRLVADATGEDVREIQRRGFSLADPAETNFDPEPDCRPPQIIDWDDLEDQRYASIAWKRSHEPTAA